MILVLLPIIFGYKSFGYNISGWSEYNKEIKSKYTFVKGISIYRITPVQIDISYRLNKIPDDNEVDAIFDDTIQFLSSDQTFADLIRYHLKRYHDPFCHIDIRFDSKQNDLENVIQITGADNGSGEPRINHYDKWCIRYNSESNQVYKTLSDD